MKFVSVLVRLNMLLFYQKYMWWVVICLFDTGFGIFISCTVIWAGLFVRKILLRSKTCKLSDKTEALCQIKLSLEFRVGWNASILLSSPALMSSFLVWNRSSTKTWWKGSWIQNLKDLIKLKVRGHHRVLQYYWFFLLVICSD